MQNHASSRSEKAKKSQEIKVKDFSERIAKLPSDQQAIRAKSFHPTGTFIEFPKAEIEQSIPKRFAKIVEKWPDRLAVKTRNHQLTYGELNDAANRVAEIVAGELGEGHEPVALLVENSASTIVAMMGVLKAGKFYVPLDPSYPPARLVTILELLNARLILTNAKNLDSLKKLHRLGYRVVAIDGINFSTPSHNPTQLYTPGAFANVVFTSGSTGQPKGVIQTHRNILLEVMNYTNAVHISGADRLILVSSPSFADSTRTIYGGLLNGACLYPWDLKQEELNRLAGWFMEQEVTLYRSVPSVFRSFVNALTGDERFPHLRLIYSAGDSATWSDVLAYKHHFDSNCVFVNGLGSTESLTYRWYFIDKESPMSGGPVPVGYAVPEKDVSVLDEHGNRIGCNEIGQFAVTSRYLSPGYWKRPDLTQAAFRSAEPESEERAYLTGDMGLMRSDGCLMHLGRKDFQVKIRGQRIEVSEIEAVLLGLEAIREAVVAAKENRAGERRLVAYLVAKKHPVPKVPAIRQALAEKLPVSMIPSSYLWMQSLPLNANKKVDRKALPDPPNDRPELEVEYRAPRTLVEAQLAAIWAHVLSLDQVGIHDSFFDLGGHSLAATQVISKVIKQFQVELPLRSLLSSATVAEMAAVISAGKGEKLSENEVERIVGEIESITEEEAQRLISRRA